MVPTHKAASSASALLACLNLIVLRCATFLLLLAVAAFAQQNQKQNGCPQTEAGWKVHTHGMTQATTAELESWAIERVAAKTPSSMRVKACVRVSVIIDSSGRVACRLAPSGHPVLRAAAEEAAAQWVFKLPEDEHGPVTGTLAFSFNTSTDENVCASN